MKNRKEYLAGAGREEKNKHKSRKVRTSGKKSFRQLFSLVLMYLSTLKRQTASWTLSSHSDR